MFVQYGDKLQIGKLLSINDHNLDRVPFIGRVAPVLSIPAVLVSRSLLINLERLHMSGTFRDDLESIRRPVPFVEQSRYFGLSAALLPRKRVRIESNDAVHTLGVSARSKNVSDLVPDIIRQMNVSDLDFGSDLAAVSYTHLTLPTILLV